MQCAAFCSQLRRIAFLVSLSFVLVVAPAALVLADETKVPLTFAGGHEIGKDDFGRPVTLIAGALGVKPAVFREAFAGVTPARGRAPRSSETQANKAALLKVLGPQGITNERLDEVADHYRFRPQLGERWPTTAAKAHAIVEDGKVKRIVVTTAGAGYCSPPTATIDLLPEVKLQVQLGFSSDFKKNGAITKIEITPAKK